MSVNIPLDNFGMFIAINIHSGYQLEEIMQKFVTRNEDWYIICTTKWGIRSNSNYLASDTYIYYVSDYSKNKMRNEDG
jgi:hypothetical protein